MIQARSTLTNELVLATPGREAICPQCQAPVRAKCGDIIAWHFAHHSAEDCDTWTEPESQWHHGWKLLVPEGRREVVIGNHRADIVAKDGTVVELQHSHLAPAVIHEREAHYGKMVWLFDVTEADIDVYLPRPYYEEPELPNHRAFRWRNPRKHIAATNAPTLLDKGGEHLLLLRDVLLDYPPYGGTGWIIPRSNVVAWLNDGKPIRQWPAQIDRLDEYEHRRIIDFAAAP